MPSQSCEDAIALAIKHNNALLKVIAKNDVSDTSNQRGFYLPKDAWKLFTPHAPTRGRNDDFDVTIRWPDGTLTNSCIHWWGLEKSEYQLTRFNRIRNFPWRRPELAGDLFVLINTGDAAFSAFVFSDNDDVEELQARLGIEVVSHWTTYPRNKPKPISESACLKARFVAFVATMQRLPNGATFADRARAAVNHCNEGFAAEVADKRLIKYVQAEYQLFSTRRSISTARRLVRASRR